MLLNNKRKCVNHEITDVKFTERTSALQQENDNRKQILPFVTQNQPAVPKRLKTV